MVPESGAPFAVLHSIVGTLMAGWQGEFDWLTFASPFSVIKRYQMITFDDGDPTKAFSQRDYICNQLMTNVTHE